MKLMVEDEDVAMFEKFTSSWAGNFSGDKYVDDDEDGDEYVDDDDEDEGRFSDFLLEDREIFLTL